MSFWAIFNGLIVVGLAFAALPGIKSGKKTILAQVYDGKQHMVSVIKNDKGEFQPTDEENKYITERVKIIIKEKLHYIIGFAMSAIGTFGTLWTGNNDMPLIICERRQKLLLSIIMWLIVAYFLSWILEKYLFKTITKNYSLEKDILVDGDIFMQDIEINKEDENK